jgi:hypothetical protein
MARGHGSCIMKGLQSESGDPLTEQRSTECAMIERQMTECRKTEHKITERRRAECHVTNCLLPR